MSQRKTSIKKFILALVLCIVFIDSFSLYSISNQGWLIHLDGTSSAGKTSVTRKLKKQLLNQTQMVFTYESHDDFLGRKWAAEDAAKEAATPQSMTKTPTSTQKTIQSNEEDDDDDPEASQYKSSSSANSDDYDDGSIKEYLIYIKNLIKSGKNIISDTVLMDEEDWDDYETVIGRDPKTVCALVYCPAKEIVARVQARNRSGDEGNERTIYQAIAQIPDMFTITNKQTDQTIDKFTKEDIDHMLQPLKNELEKDNKKRIKKGKKPENIKKTIRNLRAKLSPKRGKISYIQPKKPHDVVVVNSLKNGPGCAAQGITDAVLQRIKPLQPPPFDNSPAINYSDRS